MVGLPLNVRRPFPAGVVASIVAAGALAGCGLSTTEIDRGQAEDFVRRAFDNPPRSVTCPSGVEAKKGGTFTCQAVDSAGKRYQVLLHMADDEGRVTVGKKDFRPVSSSG